MGSKVIKIQTCDFCPNEARAEAVSSLPHGWARLTVYGGNSKDMCNDCYKIIGSWK